MNPTIGAALSLGKGASRSRKYYERALGPSPGTGSMLPVPAEQGTTPAGAWQSITEGVRWTSLVTLESPQPGRSARSLVILAGGQESKTLAAIVGDFLTCAHPLPPPQAGGTPSRALYHSGTAWPSTATWTKLPPLANFQSLFPLTFGHPGFGDIESTL